MQHKTALPHTLVTLLSFILGFLCHWYFFGGSSDQLKQQGLNDYQAFTQLQPSINTDKRYQNNSNDNDHVSPAVLSFEEIALELLLNENLSVNRAKLTLLLTQWAHQDPYEVLVFLKNNNKEKYIMLVMEIAGLQQNIATFDWLQRHDDEKQYPYWLEQYFSYYAQVAPLDALALSLQIKQKNSQQQMLIAIVNQWLPQEPESVFSWIEQQPKSSFIEELTFNTLSHYIALAPWQAAEKINELPNNARKQQLIMTLVDKISQDNIYDALDWIASLPGNQEREALGNVLSNWANNGRADEVLDYVLNRDDLPFESPAYQAALINISNNMPDILLTRIHDFHEINQQKVISIVAVSQINQNPDNPYQWVELITDKVLYDFAVNATIDASYHFKPEAAFERAENIYLASDRARYLEKIALAWAGLDKAAALKAVQLNQSLNDNQKRALLSRMEKK